MEPDEYNDETVCVMNCLGFDMQVVEYLISKGIDSSRLIGVGYGKTKLLINCTNEENCSDQ